MLKDIYQEIEQSFLNNRDRLIQFFQDQGFEESQAEELTGCLKIAVFFLETHEYDREDIEKDIREERRAARTKKITDLENLIKYSAPLYEIVPQLDWKYIFETHMNILHNYMFYRTRAGKNKSLEVALYPLFWKLQKFGKGPAKQVRFVYDLFVQFELDDYGKEYSTKDVLIGEEEQKERIRKQFQQSAIKSRDEYAEIFGWDT